MDEFWKNNGSTILVGVVMLILGAMTGAGIAPTRSITNAQK